MNTSPALLTQSLLPCRRGPLRLAPRYPVYLRTSLPPLIFPLNFPPNLLVELCRHRLPCPSAALPPSPPCLFGVCPAAVERRTDTDKHLKKRSLQLVSLLFAGKNEQNFVLSKERLRTWDPACGSPCIVECIPADPITMIGKNPLKKKHVRTAMFSW
jgi:hypothetical protein